MLRISTDPETLSGQVQRDTPPGHIQQLRPCLQPLCQPFVPLPKFFIQPDQKILQHHRGFAETTDGES